VGLNRKGMKNKINSKDPISQLSLWYIKNKYFCGQCLDFSFQPTNNAHYIHMSFCTQQHCYVSLKTYTLSGFEPGSSCSWGGCVVHCATQPGHVLMILVVIIINITSPYRTSITWSICLRNTPKFIIAKYVINVIHLNGTGKVISLEHTNRLLNLYN
jgi:hypothetical protein